MSVCGAEGCGQPAAIQWQRRSSDEEWTAQVELAQQRWRDLTAAGVHDPAEVPEDVFVPKDGLALRAVFACAEHEPADPNVPAVTHPATCTVPCSCILEVPDA